MFMHIPLNHWKDSIGYGRTVFMIIGIGVPLIITLIVNFLKKVTLNAAMTR